MRILAIMRKEMRLLARSKSSTLALLFGPLLVILIVGLVFTNAGQSELIVGYVTDAEFVEFTDSLDESFTTIQYDSSDVCADAVRQGGIAACVVFSSGDPPKATLIVDPSDINAVYAVIEQISGQIDEQSTRVRQSLTQQLLAVVSQSAEVLSDERDNLEQSVFLANSQQEKTRELVNDIQDIELDIAVVNQDDVADAIDSSVNARDDYRMIAYDILESYESFVRGQRSEEDSFDSQFNAIDEYEDSLDEIGNQTQSDEVFSELLSSLRDLDNEVSRSRTQAQAMTSQAAQIRGSLVRLIDDLESSQQAIAQESISLSSVGISEGDITTPIDTQIEPVVPTGNTLGFIFPYFLVLIVMFTGVLLASSVIVRERESAAYFRNFVTAAPEWVFVVATFITTSLLLMIQSVLILLLAGFVIDLPLIANIGPLLVILLCTVSFFTLLGMAVGYLVKTREGVMLASIGVSSVLLFVSGFVFPTQSLPEFVRLIVSFNPFVVAAELIKAVVLFGYPLGQLSAYLFALILYGIALFVLIMIIQRVARVRFFERDTADEITAFLGQEQVEEKRRLILDEYEISSLEQLRDTLQKVSDQQYERYCSHEENAIIEWIKDVYKDESLAVELKNKSRIGAIKVLNQRLS